MKIYVLIEDPYIVKSNPYIRTLIDGINYQYKDVNWGYGIDKFWEDTIFDYDIIHIHWPNILIWYNDIHIKKDPDIFEKRIREIKLKNIKIISTCHNLKPHYSKNFIEHKLYDITYNYSDCIIHLGNYSLSLFKEKYPNTLNYLLYHHIYDDIYKFSPKQEEGIKSLNLDLRQKHILCFGAFRNKEEQNLIIKLSKHLKNKKIKIVAPSFFIIPSRRNIIAYIKTIIKYLYYKYKYSNIITSLRYVNDNKLPYYFAACNITLIQRLDILNSGNVPLAFLMKKVVVGPNKGNVGDWLNKTQNYTFEVNDINSLYRAIDLALNDEQKGNKNYLYAINNLTTEITSSKLYKLYKKILALNIGK